MVLAAALALASIGGNRAEPSFADADKKTIVLDAGHGDPDGGAIGATGSVESTLNLSVAKKLKSKLEKKGFTVIMSGRTKTAYTVRPPKAYAKKSARICTKGLKSPTARTRICSSAYI